MGRRLEFYLLAMRDVSNFIKKEKIANERESFGRHIQGVRYQRGLR